MQYLIRMVCDESTDFRRDILIDEDATFLRIERYDPQVVRLSPTTK